ncbi:MAG: histidinol phosphate phosphatase [Candidatus Omnitrophica bacterium CG11_big_fil_rev_8_21_14_0_20_63_9]|nr:MAG: histidinol phosphate phosphatase [Candidatus Omnitrophica bacterium CG11_big_fil_rev_8_21_14_0_20_63_9]
MTEQVSQRPRQAVILAGGRGTRLRPLTDTRPKPMIEFDGKPFLGHLLELLRAQGIEQVLLLLGYRPEAVQSYCGNGHAWGLDIQYVVSAVEDETGRRLKLAAPQIEPTFLFLYCDNYWPMPLDRLWQRYTEAGVPGLLTVYRNRDGYTRDNVQVDRDGFIVTYDKERKAEGLSGVEIGYGIFSREVLSWLPDENVSFERVVYPQLVAKRQLAAFQTDHRYYSVSSHERLPLTQQFLARKPAIILDRDGVLNRRPPKAEYVRSWEAWEWLPGALEALRLLKEAGCRIIVVSNQAGVARGVMTAADVEAIHERMRADVRSAGSSIDAVYYCPHGWDEGCECRKPKPGMLHQAQRDFHLDLSRTYFIGDDERDGQAADAAGCPWVLVADERPLLDIVRDVIDVREANVLHTRSMR